MTNIQAKIRVYLDTSVVSYLEQEDAPEQRVVTRKIWETLKSPQYEIIVSDVVIKEIMNCSDDRKRQLLLNHLDELHYKFVNVTDETVAFAEHIIDFGILKQKSYDDCQHIAAAVVNNCDFIISWNFKHIVNVKTIKGIKILTTTDGYRDIAIYSPLAFQDEENEL